MSDSRFCPSAPTECGSRRYHVMPARFAGREVLMMLSYGRELKLLVRNNSSAREVSLMSFDRATARLEAMKDE